MREGGAWLVASRENVALVTVAMSGVAHAVKRCARVLYSGMRKCGCGGAHTVPHGGAWSRESTKCVWSARGIRMWWDPSG